MTYAIYRAGATYEVVERETGALMARGCRTLDAARRAVPPGLFGPDLFHGAAEGAEEVWW